EGHPHFFFERLVGGVGASGLAHEPDGRARGAFAPGGAHEQIVAIGLRELGRHGYSPAPGFTEWGLLWGSAGPGSTRGDGRGARTSGSPRAPDALESDTLLDEVFGRGDADAGKYGGDLTPDD